MTIQSIEAQIARLQRQAEALQQQEQAAQVDRGPVGWRREDREGQWHLVNTAGFTDEALRRKGCEPIFSQALAMPEAAARQLMRQHKGAALVRAVEAWHGVMAMQA
jgi:hypothetical protein